MVIIEEYMTKIQIIRASAFPMILLAAEEECLVWVRADRLILVQDWLFFQFYWSERTVG